MPQLLAVNPGSGELIGLACQQLHSRVDKPADEGVAAARERDSRESLLWVNAGQRIGAHPKAAIGLTSGPGC